MRKYSNAKFEYGEDVLYRVIAFNDRKEARLYRSVRVKDMQKLGEFLKKNWPGVQYMNFYLKKTRQYMGRLYIT